jgi:hypothetical protein
MNRYRKEQLKKYTPEEIEQMEAAEKKQHREDCKNFPELYSFIGDSSWDLNDRSKGISPMTKEFRAKMRERFNRGEYPERLHGLVWAELNLKHPEE